MKKIAKAALFAVALAATPAPALAAAVVTGFDTTVLPRNDDSFFGPQTLGFSANYFGTTYTDTFVSNNGYVTFGAGQGTFTPGGLGAGYAGLPIIAAFFADVDTRNISSGLIGFGTGTFGGRNAWGTTWDGVGYFSHHVDKLNTFQLLLVDRSDVGAGDFDIVFNYDNIDWETGDFSGGTGGLGGTSAAVGYNAGQPGNPPGTFFEFTGSRVNGALIDGGPNSLVANSNVGLAGRYLFTVRNGIVDPGMGAVPEPATWAMMLIGFGFVGGSIRSARARRMLAAA